MSHQRAEALFDFNPTAGVELKIQKGDVIHVHRTSVGDGWWEGELDGYRGLFPSSYVRLLPEDSLSHEPPRSMTPLTPMMSKRAFMETLLAPPSLAFDQFYSKEKAAEIFLQQYCDVTITVGPSWYCQPPHYTVSVKQFHWNSRASGSKQLSTYVVETKELFTSVTRKFKHFLWLYDKMAEVFPCISLPPIPIKQRSTPKDFDGMKSRRAGLEKFLARVARHPVLSCTKLFHLFLTTKDDKEWRIGRHNSHIKAPKSAKKLFGAPVYMAVKYPAYNVPLNQLASIEKFSKFTGILETNVQALQTSCTLVSNAMGELMSSLGILGKDMQKFSNGIQLITGAHRRKMLSSTSILTNSGQAPIHANLAAPVNQKVFEDEETSEDEGEGGGEWNWREDESFHNMTKELHDIAGGIRTLSQFGQRHQDNLDEEVVDTFREYSGIIHTLPVLVKLHEEAMEIYNASKEKDTKKEAEEVRQHCETLNNILLSEFDHFSVQMVQDFENLVEMFLQQQVNFHTQMASEWDALHRLYAKRLSSSSASTRKNSFKAAATERGSRHSGDSQAAMRSETFKRSFTSSQESNSSPETLRGSKSNLKSAIQNADSVPPKSDSYFTANSDTVIPAYINVQWNPVSAGSELTEADIIDPEMLKPKKKIMKKEKEKDRDDEGEGVEERDEVDEVRGEEEEEEEGGEEEEENGNHTPLLQDALPAYPSLEMSKLGESDPFIKEHSGHQDNQTLTAAEELATPQNHGLVIDQAPRTGLCPRYEECTLLSAPPASNIEIGPRYETSFPVHLPAKQQDNLLGSPPKYINLTILEDPSSSSVSTGGVNTLTKELLNSSKKPIPSQRMRTKSTDNLLEETASLQSTSLTSVNTVTSSSSVSGKLSCFGKKKPIPPVKPPKFSSANDHSSPSKCPLVLPGSSKKKLSRRFRSHSSSKSDEGDTVSELSELASKPRSKTHTSSEQRGDMEVSVEEHYLPTSPPVSAQKNVSLSPVSSKAYFCSSSLSALDMMSALKTNQEKALSPGKKKMTTDTSGKDKLLFLPPPSTSSAKSRSLTRCHTTDVIGIDFPADEHTHKRTVTASGKRPPPPMKPPRGSVSRVKISSVSKKGSLQVAAASSGAGGGGEVMPPKGTAELLRKLTKRRIRIEEQATSSSKSSRLLNPNPGLVDPCTAALGDSYERNSGHSAHSDVVVAYHVKAMAEGRKDPGMNTAVSMGSNGVASGNYGMDDPNVTVDQRRGEEEDGTLASYGVIEDLDGGSYLI